MSIPTSWCATRIANMPLTYLARTNCTQTICWLHKNDSYPWLLCEKKVGRYLALPLALLVALLVTLPVAGWFELLSKGMSNGPLQARHTRRPMYLQQPHKTWKPNGSNYSTCLCKDTEITWAQMSSICIQMPSSVPAMLPAMYTQAPLICIQKGVGLGFGFRVQIDGVIEADQEYLKVQKTAMQVRQTQHNIPWTHCMFASG